MSKGTAPKPYQLTCIECDTVFERDNPRFKYCTKAQRQRRAQRGGMNTKAGKTCKHCGAEGVRYDADYCSRRCRHDAERGPVEPEQLSLKIKDDRRGPLRRAYESGDLHALRIAILDRCEVDPQTGCWNWQGSLNGGYASATLAGRSVAVHRLVMGEPNEPVVHHKCANTQCVNYAHLQLVTQRENAAEMLERNHYKRTIAEQRERIARLEALLGDHGIALPD